VTDTALAEAKASFDRIMVDPSPADLWVLQQALLVVGTEPATRARAVARAFHACLRNLESKSASRTASRWGAVLGTAAVGSVSVGEMGNTREAALQGLVHGAVPAVLEVGAALKSAQAWEVEAGLVYDDLAWFLYDELWDIATTTRPDLSPDERRNQAALVIDPLLDATVPDDDRAALVVQVFRTVLAARLVPLFGESRNGDGRNGDAPGD
jgi:hypothetical protein